MIPEDEDIYIWRDLYDKSLFVFGVKFGRDYKSLLSVSRNDMEILFGEENIKMLLKSVSKKPTSVKIKFEIVR